MHSITVAVTLLCISCDFLVNEQVKIAAPKENYGKKISEDSEKCTEIIWSPDSKDIYYTTDSSFFSGYSSLKKYSTVNAMNSVIADTMFGKYESVTMNDKGSHICYLFKHGSNLPVDSVDWINRPAEIRLNPVDNGSIIKRFPISRVGNQDKVSLVIAPDASKIACATSDSCFVFDSTGTLLLVVEYQLGYPKKIPAMFTQNVSSLYFIERLGSQTTLYTYSFSDSSFQAGRTIYSSVSKIVHANGSDALLTSNELSYSLTNIADGTILKSIDLSSYFASNPENKSLNALYISKDCSYILFSIGKELQYSSEVSCMVYEIQLYNSSSDTATTISSGGSYYTDAEMSPDGKYAVYTVDGALFLEDLSS
jgi:hypothetical protein